MVEGWWEGWGSAAEDKAVCLRHQDIFFNPGNLNGGKVLLIQREIVCDPPFGPSGSLLYLITCDCCKVLFYG